MLQTISIIVSGKVQGVFFRQSTKEIAISIGLSGVVRNLSNGDVYIIATGTKEQLDKLADWCRQGPAKASVAGIAVQESPLLQFDGFSIQRF
jgi:acylphosphatase